MLNTFSNPEFRLSEQNFSKKMVRIKRFDCIKQINLKLISKIYYQSKLARMEIVKELHIATSNAELKQMESESETDHNKNALGELIYKCQKYARSLDELHP